MPVALIRTNGCVRSVNQCFVETFGWTTAELEGKPLPLALDRHVASPASPSHLRTRDGRLLHVVVHRSSHDDGTLLAFHDVTRQHRVAREFDRLSALYATLVDLKNALRGARSQQEVFQEVCRVVTAHGGLKLMWIGRVEPDSGRVVPVARAGQVEGYVETLEIYVDRPPSSAGPTATSIREGAAVVFNDFLRDPRARPWHAPARIHGLRAVMALPIRFQGQIWGSFTVYAGEPGVFGEREVSLLGDLALDISLALDAIEVERKRREAEAALTQREQELSTVLRSAHDGFLLMDDEGRILATNDSYCEMTGYTEAEVLQRRIPDLDVHLTLPEVQDIVADIIVARNVRRFETVHQRKDGSRVEVEVTANPLPGADGKLVAFLRDITDRKRAAREIQRRLALEERLSKIAATAPGVIYTFQVHDDGRMTIPYASPTMTHLFGVTPEQVERDFSHVLESVHPDDRDAFTASVTTAIQTGEPWRHTFRVQHAQRGELWLEGHSVPHREADGQLTWVGYVSDATEQRKAEAALRESETRLRAMADSIDEVFWMSDARFNVLFISAGFERIWGVPVASVWQDPQAWLDAVVPDDRPLLRNAVALACTGTGSDIQYRIRRPDGEIRWVRGRSFPQSDDDGNVTIIYGVSADVTEQRHAEEELRKLSRAVEQSTSSIVITDTHGCIEYVNPRFTKVTGYASDEAVGQHSRFLLSDETPREVFEHMWTTLARGHDWQGDFVNRRKDGRTFIEHTRLSPIFDERGRITHYLAVADDVTAQRDLEAGLRQAQKMDALGRLAGGIAHDFGNLLLIIDGYCKVLLDDGLPPQYHDAMKQIQGAAQRASALNRQLLAFGRRQKSTPRPLDIDDVIDGTAQMIGRVLGEGIELAHVRSPQKATVFADAVMLDQVFLNLAMNARDAMPQGGRLEIGTRIVDYPAGAPHPGTWVRVSMTDTGSGIPSDLLPRIFEPFFTTKTKTKGSGLGLASVYGIVEQHQGWLDVESEVSKGSAFIVHLPFLDEEDRPDEGPAPLGHGRILLAEDEPPVRDLLAHMLVRLGYSVVEAADADAALALWEREEGRFDALVTDIVMPGPMNGFELGRHLQALRPDLPVLHISGYNNEPEGVLTEGVNYLTKPCSSTQLGHTLHALLEGVRSGSSAPPAPA